MKEKDKVIYNLKKIVGKANVIISDWGKQPFSKGWSMGVEMHWLWSNQED